MSSFLIANNYFFNFAFNTINLGCWLQMGGILLAFDGFPYSRPLCWRSAARSDLRALPSALSTSTSDLSAFCSIRRSTRPSRRSNRTLIIMCVTCQKIKLPPGLFSFKVLCDLSDRSGLGNPSYSGVSKTQNLKLRKTK